MILVKITNDKFPIKQYQSLRFKNEYLDVISDTKKILEIKDFKSTPKKYEEHWHALENFKIYLDTIESEIIYKENLRSKKIKFLDWFRKNRGLNLINYFKK